MNFNLSNKNQSNKGATLLGLLVSVVIIGMTLTGGLALMTRNIRMSSITTHEIVASSLAEEGVAIARNIRDTVDNYCLDEGVDLVGFNKISGPDQVGQAFALDYEIETYQNGDILSSASGYRFRNPNAGLCQESSSPRLFATCGIKAGNRKFIRKIQILDGDKTINGIRDCDTVAGGEGGVLIVASVYWSEVWENKWPADTSSSMDDLHKVQITNCLYNWRPK